MNKNKNKDNKQLKNKDNKQLKINIPKVLLIFCVIALFSILIFRDTNLFRDTNQCDYIRVDFYQPINLTIIGEDNNPTRWVMGQGFFVESNKEVLIPEEIMPFKLECVDV